MLFLKLFFVFFELQLGKKASAPGNGADLIFRCDSCRSILQDLAADVRYLNQKNLKWSEEVLRERVGHSCSSPLIPSGPTKKVCGQLLQSSSRVIMDEVLSRWNPASDDFETDLVPSEVCEKLKACKPGQKSLPQMMKESERHQGEL